MISWISTPRVALEFMSESVPNANTHMHPGILTLKTILVKFPALEAYIFVKCPAISDYLDGQIFFKFACFKKVASHT